MMQQTGTNILFTVEERWSKHRQRKHRLLVVLSGTQDWCYRNADLFFEHFSRQKVLWVSNRTDLDRDVITPDKAIHQLGSEHHYVVYDAFSGFNPDAFAAISGTVCGGGMLVLLIPDLDAWPVFEDPEYRKITVFPYQAADIKGRYLQRFSKLLQESPDSFLFAERQFPNGWSKQHEFDKAPFVHSNNKEFDKTFSEDQENAVQAIQHVVTGQRRRPVVLMSDRGRGKSASMGIAAARLMQDGIKIIILTAPGKEAVTSVFKHARMELQQKPATSMSIHCRDSTMEFLPPDELCRNLPEAHLVLVDEAASIPTPMLEVIVEHYSRVAFATTIHGYEGTGRGFEIRFSKILDEKTRGWRIQKLEAPIRWSKDDPLERFVFDSVMLNAMSASNELLQGAVPSKCTIEKLDRDQLLENESLLRELFGLLVSAHYRTRPYDLRYLMDGPNLSIYVIRFKQHVLATALIASEGGFSQDLARNIEQGTTRPHGHLLPESLASHAGFRDAAELSCWRVMRIAVHPDFQHKGFGSKLLKNIVEDAKQAGKDYIGSSFGVSRKLVSFWKSLDFSVVRLSTKPNATSGACSVIVLKGLSSSGTRLSKNAEKRFQYLFLHQLAEHQRDLDANIALNLLSTPGAKAKHVENSGKEELLAFSRGHRIYEEVIDKLWGFLILNLNGLYSNENLTSLQKKILLMKVVQKLDWKIICQRAKISGRKELLQQLRSAVDQLLNKN